MMSMNDMNNPILSYFFSFSSFYCRFSIVQNGSVFRIFHVEHTDIIIVYREQKSIFPFGNCAWSAPYIIRISTVTVFCISVCKVISNSWCRNRPHSRVCFFSAFYSYKKKTLFCNRKGCRQTKRCSYSMWSWTVVIILLIIMTTTMMMMTTIYDSDSHNDNVHRKMNEWTQNTITKTFLSLNFFFFFNWRVVWLKLNSFCFPLMECGALHYEHRKFVSLKLIIVKNATNRIKTKKETKHFVEITNEFLRSSLSLSFKNQHLNLVKRHNYS